jgi:hypothetical protein
MLYIIFPLTLNMCSTLIGPAHAIGPALPVMGEQDLPTRPSPGYG